MPDSSLRSDLAVERKRKMDEYSFLINAPGANKLQLTKEVMDFLQWSPECYNPQPPQPHPEPTRPTFAFKGDDLNPLAPQFPIVLQILQQSGVAISQDAIQQARGGAQNAILAHSIQQAAAPVGPQGEPQHGGKLPQLENLSKHAAALTGGMQGTGEQIGHQVPGVTQ